MRHVVVALILGGSSTASAQSYFSGGGTGGVAEARPALPTARLLFGVNAEIGTATTVEGTEYDLKGGGFGIDVAFHLGLPWVQPYFRGNIDANLVSREDPCRPSPFDPNTLECEDAGGSGRVLGGAQGGLRFVYMTDGVPSRFGLAVGAQYLIQGIYTNSATAEDENELLPYAQVDYAARNGVLSFGAGLGGWFMGEYAATKEISIFRTVVFRIERWGWEREESVVEGFQFHLLMGSVH